MTLSTNPADSVSPKAPLNASGQLFLWLAVAIFATSGAVSRKLTELGTMHPVDGRNPISFCNLLFVGNLCALLVMIPLYRKQLTPAVFRQLTRQDWLSMLTVAVLVGALAPALFLSALSMTMVNNVTLVSRVEPLLTLLLSTWLLHERTTVWEFLGAIVSFVGVLVTVALQGMAEGGMSTFAAGNVGKAELMTVIAAIALAVASIVSRSRLGRIQIGTFSVVRTAVGTVVFFFIALLVYGPHHFTDSFSPFLWQWMLLYGTLIVVLGQSLWLAGLKRTGLAEASLVEAFNPVGALLAAYLLLAEVPTEAQWIGGGIILGGIALSLFGVHSRSKMPGDRPETMAMGSSFRGI